MTGERQATLYGLTAVLLWSTVATAFKLGLQHYSPAQLLLLAAAASCILFWLAALVTGSLKVRRADMVWIPLLGVINPAAYYLILFEAYDRLPAQIAQPLNYTWAIVLALLAVPLLRQPLSVRSVTGIVVGYLGVVVLLYRSDTDIALDSTGILLAIVSTVLWAAYWILNTRITSNPLAVMTWSFTFALPLLAIWCATMDTLPSLISSGWPYALWVGLLEMGVTFLLWQQALKRTSQVARISQLIFFSPFISLALISFVLGEQIRGTSILGLGIIVVGVLLTQSATTTPPTPRQSRAGSLPE